MGYYNWCIALYQNIDLFVTFLLFQYASKNYPNPFMIPALSSPDLTPDLFLMGSLNPARKKKARLQATCDFIRYSGPLYGCRKITRRKCWICFRASDLDVIHLQEIWYRKDYDFLKDCTMDKYQASPFDSECGAINSVRLNTNPKNFSHNNKHYLEHLKGTKVGTIKPLP